MPVSEPRWWYEDGPQWQATLLSPIAALVGAIASFRLRRAAPYRSRLPVICVGNFTAGGSGKTPLAMFLADRIKQYGREPWFLSRGYGGRLSGPVQVVPEVHTAHDVGDEPLLLARCAPTVVSRNRREGARLIEARAPSNAVIIMDDGLQNPALCKDLSIALIDARRGIGNGRVIPAGPLRLPLSVQTKLANLIIVSNAGKDRGGPITAELGAVTGLPTISAESRLSGDNTIWRGRHFIAYAGIANPNRFFTLLEDLGATLVERRTFADHHAFSEADASDLLEAARITGAELVTTEKDMARLIIGTGPLGELARLSHVLAIETVIEGDDLQVLDALVRGVLVR